MKRGSREIGNGEGISIITSRRVGTDTEYFKISGLLHVVAKPVGERKKLGVGTSTEVWVKSIRHASKGNFRIENSRNFVLGVSSPVALEMAGSRDPQI
jgi:hypothetical protein